MTRAASVAVAWFRRDLRVHDHPALVHAVERFDRVAPLFVVDDRLLVGLAAAGDRERFVGRAGARGPTSRGDRWVGCPSRVWFMGRSLAALSGSLGDVGADLSILRGDPVDIVPRFAAAMGAQAVIVSRDYAPNGRRRDAAVEAACRRLGIELVARRGVVVHEPEAVRRLDGGSFSVFTPMQRAWGAAEPRPTLALLRRSPARGGLGTRAGRSRTSSATSARLPIRVSYPSRANPPPAAGWRSGSVRRAWPGTAPIATGPTSRGPRA